MGFILWHYTAGINQYLKRWCYALGWINHFFSLTLLPASLFSPWKRLTITKSYVGFNLSLFFQNLSFNLISRIIGAIVRTWLFAIGIISLFPVIIVGFIGLLFWLCFPPIGFLYYFFRDSYGQRFLESLVQQVIEKPESAIFIVLDNRPGRFICHHLGLTINDLSSNTQKILPQVFTQLRPKKYSEIIKQLIDFSAWPQSFYSQNNLTSNDILIAAKWWDFHSHGAAQEDSRFHYSRPGIGLNLLFGYTPTLDKYSQDLSLNITFSHHLIGREQLVSRIDRSLSGGSSVIIHGLPGVGKKTIVLELARRAKDGLLGKAMSYKRIMELDYNFLLSESLDINQKKNLLSQILHESANAGNVILVIKDIYRLTSLQAEGLDFTDIFERYLETNKLKIIALESNVEYERFIVPNNRLRKFLEPIEAVSPTKEEAMDILISFADTWESQKKITILSPALRAIIEGSDQYISDTPYPEKALELLDHVINYVDRQSRSTITPDDVNFVLSETTGISMARIGEREKDILSNLEEVLHQNLVNQDQAVNLIAKTLRSRSVGIKSDQRPIGSFLFLGPSGVGKTQTAKSLAQVYYGSSQYILRFDMAEYAGIEGLSRLIGSVAANQPGKLTTDIKNRPASLLLLDEIDKAPSVVFNLFLSLLDEGQITDAFGKKINCKHLFVIATSNAGSEYVRELVNNSTPYENLTRLVLDHIQKQGIFSPEFLNRFDAVVVYEPLDADKLVQVAKLLLKDLIANLARKNIILDVAEDVSQKVASVAVEPEFGARPMRREVDLNIGDVIGKEILNGNIKPGNKIRLVTDPDNRYSIQIVN